MLDDDLLRFPLQRHLTALAWHVGHDLNPDALDPTLPAFGELVSLLVDAAGRHAAATHLWHQFDEPLTFLLEVISDGPIDTHEADLQQLTALLHLRKQLLQQRQQAIRDVADACRGLTVAGVTTATRHTPAPLDPPRRDAAPLAALDDAGFLAVLDEHRTTTRGYRLHHSSAEDHTSQHDDLCVGAVHADLGADGALFLSGAADGNGDPWHITASESAPTHLLTALLRACTPSADRAPNPRGPDPAETTGDHPHGRRDV
ncbi:hypothetical protein ACFPIJ_56535 [Dactylosporangium cerinum]|uniref:Uncharacterized protein n=2 Tax=Dactylosporangium cerinum TaxID=1434730 RepID=A0ABV9WFR0_9ACTN